MVKILLTRFVLMALVLCFSVGFSTGQDDVSTALSELAARYNPADRAAYLQPFSDVLGGDLNTGWYRDALIKKSGFQLYFGIVTQAAIIRDPQKTFNASTPAYFQAETSQNSYEVPTVIGPNSSVRVDGLNGTAYTFSGGAGLSLGPIATPQISIGSLFGTEVSFRFLPINFGDDVGKLQVFGIGARHSISQYLGDFPVALAIGYYYNQLSVDDDWETTSQFISGQGSYNVGKLTLYGGLGYEIMSSEFLYTDPETDAQSTINMEDGNSIRFTFGAAINLGVFNLSADYNIAKQHTASIGIGVNIGKKEFYEKY